MEPYSSSFCIHVYVKNHRMYPAPPSLRPSVKNTDRISCSIFFEPFLVIFLFHALHHCFLAMDWISDGLNNLLLIEDAFSPRTFHPPNIFFPRKVLDSLEKFFKSRCLKPSDLDHNTFCRTQKMLARQIASSSPSNVTLPSSTFVIS